MFARVICLLALAAGMAPAAWAQPYPAKSIAWVVPFAPGGITDTTSRMVTKKLGELLGQTFVVENRPGAGGSVGTEIAARAAPDGYTVLYATQGTMAANVTLYKKLKYDPLRDFIPVHGMFQSPTILVVDASKPYKTLAEFIAYAKANPGKLYYGSAGAGTSTHLTSELFQRETGTSFVHVPYKGSTPALQDMLGGRVDVMFDYSILLTPHIKSGRLRALAVTGNKRMETMPEVPTVAEAGFAEAMSSSWSGIVVPAGTPPEVVKKLAAAMQTALADKEIVDYAVNNGSVLLNKMGPAEFKDYIVAEQKKWGEIVRKSGATLD